MNARTSFTLTDIDNVMKELEQVRRQGFASVDQEVEIGLRSIAVPLKNARGNVVAALNIGLPVSPDTMPALIDRYLKPLLQVSGELSRILS
jgi:IclR family pca regulon transcriptional regulator